MNQQQAGDDERDDSLWVVVLKAEGEGPPTGRRVARLLKAALRAHGLRCVKVGGVELLAGNDAGCQSGEGREDKTECLTQPTN